MPLKHGSCTSDQQSQQLNLCFIPNTTFADLVLPPLCGRSGRAGFELQFGRGRCVVQRVRHPQKVVVRSDVDPPYWCVRSRPQLTPGGQRTCSHCFCLCGQKVLVLVRPTASSAGVRRAGGPEDKRRTQNSEPNIMRVLPLLRCGAPFVTSQRAEFHDGVQK